MRLHAILLALCLCAAVLAHKLTPHQLLADTSPVVLANMIAANVGSWKIESDLQKQIVTSPELDAKIASVYSQVLTRRYKSQDGYEIMLSIAYTKDQRDNSGQQSHKPEVCYPAQGFEILSKDSSFVGDTKLPVIRLFTVNHERYEPVTYFTTIGNQVANSNIQAKMAQIKYSIDGYVPDGVIFRVSSIDQDYKRAYKKQDEFIKAIINATDNSSRLFPSIN